GGNFEMDMNSITNKDLEGEYKGKLEGHLKSADFFDVANHPKANFEITSIKPGESDSVIQVSGNLNLRGVSKNITFNAITKNISNTNVVADATFNIAREDWGVNYTGKKDNLVSKEINLDIHLVAEK
ncbi:MAG: YceI family protein, partial [Ginsengibacter sp.]